MQTRMKTLQIDTKIFLLRWSSILKVSKIASLQCLYYISKKKLDEVDVLDADKHQSFLQVDFYTLVIKISCKVILSLLMGMIKHSQSTQSNIFEVFLQHLKIKLGMVFIFYMQINIKTSTS